MIILPYINYHIYVNAWLAEVGVFVFLSYLIFGFHFLIILGVFGVFGFFGGFSFLL